jgi:putative permease
MSNDRNNSPAWLRPVTAMFLTGIAFALFFWFFSAFSTVFLGVLAASIVACALSPLVQLLPFHRGVGAGVIGLGLITTAAAIVLGISLTLAKPIQREVADWPRTKYNIDTMLSHWSTDLKLNEALTSEKLLGKISDFFGERGSVLVSGSASAALAILLWIAFVFVGSIFLLASPPHVLLAPVLRVVPTPFRSDTLRMLEHLGQRLRWWVMGTLAGMTVVFIASCLGYAISGVQFFLPLALLAGLGEMVPTVGPACAAAVALLFAFSQSGGAATGVVITYIIVQSLEAYLILPLIMRGAVQIHPAVTLFSVILWAKIFGVPGMMLAIPINLTIASAVEYLYVRPRDRAIAHHELEMETVPPEDERIR